MARIKTYTNDLSLNDNDKLIGTDINDSEKTKNYKLSELKSYFTSGINQQLGWGRYDDGQYVSGIKKH